MGAKGLERILIEFLNVIGKTVLVFDTDSKVIYANTSAIEELSLDKEAYPNMESIIPSYMGGKLSFFDFATKFSGESFHMTIYCTNHVCFPAEVRFGTWKEEQYGFCIVSNLTQDEELMHELKRADNEAKELRDICNNFVSNVTHELRTPLNGFRGHLAQLESLDGNTEKHMDIYRIMNQCSVNMEKIVNNILDYNKLRSGKFQLEETQFSLSNCIQNIYETNEMAAHQKGLFFTAQIDDDIPDQLFGDEMHLQQVLNNLVSNAIKFTASGFVKVKVVKVYHLGKKVELFFVVMDSGIGISAEERNRIFDSFVQADASITRKYGGTGLGLSITKELLQMMGSSIRLESEKGEGSTFSFSLTLQTVEEQGSGEHPADKNDETIYSELEEERQRQKQMNEVGTEENRKQLKSNMEKLILCIEIGNWMKAEQFATYIKQLLATGDEAWRKQALRLEMAVRKENYEKAVDMYDKLKQELSDLNVEL